MNDELLSEISKKIDLIITLLIQSNTKDLNNIESTRYLSDIGFSNIEIGKYQNLKPNVVTARLSQSKKKDTKKDGSKK